MGTFLVYIIKSALCLTLLYLPYTLLLRKERLHRLNRMALLAILAASFLFPLSQEEWFGGMWHSWQSAAPEGAYAGLIDRLGRTELFMPEVVIMPDADVPVWPLVCVCLYFAGLAVSLSVRMYQFFRMRRAISRGCLWREHFSDGITLYCHARPMPPFSWMHSVVMCEGDLEGDAGEAILMHEKAHVLYGHSYDTLLMLAVEALQWFNPVVWMMEMDLRCIHEYQADEYVLSHGVNAKNYQLYLIKKAVGSRLQSFANGLNQSTLKKRIAMMCNKKSTKWAVLKYMYLLPVGAFATVAFARPEIVNGVDGRLEQLSAVKVTDLSATAKAVVAENVQPEPLKTGKNPQNAEKHLGEVAKTPLTATKTDTSSVSLSRTLEKVVVKAMAPLKTSAGVVEFKEVTCVENGKEINGKRQKDSTSYYLSKKGAKIKKHGVYERVEVAPYYPGGAEGLMKYIAQNIRYPKACRDALVQGTVYCQFVVQADGTVDGEHIQTFTGNMIGVDSPDRKELVGRLMSEAERIVKQMPRWTPGQINGKPVDAIYTMPVEFRLQ
ncbi:M56 family metallopeptidase [Paraprevotella clara]|uniref:M56 family metallopeptidase n=1 Tax=Paraprevotella clara TaxID=454154 RepID=UPI00267543ED|nr:M56 family metallopeptidase [Paraprevotella clara]